MGENNNLIGQRILILVLILIMAGIVFVGVKVLTKDDSSKNNNISTENIVHKENNNEVEENNNTVVEEEEEKDGIITEINLITDIENKSNEEIENIVKNTLNEYKKIQEFEKSNIGPMPYLLSTLELENVDKLDKLSRGQADSNGYIKSNTDYEKFKNVLLQYVTEDYFTKYFSQYRNIDGKVAFCNCAGGGIAIEIEEAKLKSKEGNKFAFDITIKDLEVYDHYLDGEEYTEEYLFKNEVEFEYVNNRLVISKYNKQIILEGVYSMDASDVAYEFYKDGTVEYSTNMAVFKGIYTVIGEKELRIKWEEKTEWDAITSEETVKKMSGIEYVDVIDEKNINVRTEVEGKTYSNEFTKIEN